MVRENMTSAERLLCTYKPVNLGRFNLMCTLFRQQETEEDLRLAATMYAMDMSFAREDIAAAESYARKLKGWK